MMKIRLILFSLLVLLIAAMPARAFAQEEPAIEPFLQGLVDYINQATTIVELALLVTVLTQALKYWIVDRFIVNPDGTVRIPSAMVHIAVQVALWGGHLVAVHFGQGPQYLEFGEKLGLFLNGIQPIIIPAVATTVVADLAYKRLHKAQVSGFRYVPSKRVYAAGATSDSPFVKPRTLAQGEVLAEAKDVRMPPNVTVGLRVEPEHVDYTPDVNG